MILLAALCIVPVAEPLRDTCACLEKNFMYDGDGRLVFCQLIVWQDDLPYPNRVMAWRMYDKIKPEVTRDGAGWKILFYDDAFKTMRVIRSASFLETHLQYDPEVLDRERWPIDQRTELTQPR